MSEKIYLLHWLLGAARKDGKLEEVKGYDIADACRKAGIGNGALRALNYWEEKSSA